MKIYNISMGGILCDIENMKISCNLIIAGWHLKERDLILYFFFSFSYCDYDHELITKKQIELLFVFTKVLIKNKNL